MRLRLNITKTTSQNPNKIQENKEEKREEETEIEDLFEGDMIEIGETSKTPSWKLVPLYRENLNGEILVWQIGFDSKSEQLKIVYGKLITSKGEQGKLITAYHPVIVNNSGRNLQEQAIQEARKRYLNQFNSKGYYPKGKELSEGMKNQVPMLSNCLKLVSLPEMEESKGIVLHNFPVNISAKIDGIRNLSRLNPDGSVNMRSRTNKPHNAPLSHIKEELSLFLKYCPQGTELDGEIYIDKMSLNEIAGIVKTKKKVHKDHDKLKYYIFDIIEPNLLCWEARYSLLVNCFNKYLEDGNPAKTFTVIQTYSANNEKEIIDYHTRFVNEGYEGLMVKRYACAEVTCCLAHLQNKEIDKMCKDCKNGYELTLYKSNRNNNLLKYKKFIDEEFEIIGYSCGTGKEQDAIMFECQTKNGVKFSCRPLGSLEYRKELYENGEELIGKLLTVKYQELSKDGCPRFPNGVAVRDYE